MKIAIIHDFQWILRRKPLEKTKSPQTIVSPGWLCVMTLTPSFSLFFTDSFSLISCEHLSELFYFKKQKSQLQKQQTTQLDNP